MQASSNGNQLSEIDSEIRQLRMQAAQMQAQAQAGVVQSQQVQAQQAQQAQLVVSDDVVQAAVDRPDQITLWDGTQALRCLFDHYATMLGNASKDETAAVAGSSSAAPALGGAAVAATPALEGAVAAVAAVAAAEEAAVVVAAPDASANEDVPASSQKEAGAVHGALAEGVATTAGEAPKGSTATEPKISTTAETTSETTRANKGDATTETKKSEETGVAVVGSTETTEGAVTSSTSATSISGSGDLRLVAETTTAVGGSPTISTAITAATSGPCQVASPPAVLSRQSSAEVCRILQQGRASEVRLSLKSLRNIVRLHGPGEKDITSAHDEAKEVVVMPMIPAELVPVAEGGKGGVEVEGGISFQVFRTYYHVCKSCSEARLKAATNDGSVSSRCFSCGKCRCCCRRRCCC
jgi:hypothetical protein